MEFRSKHEPSARIDLSDPYNYLKECDHEDWQWKLFLIFYFILKMGKEEMCSAKIVQSPYFSQGSFQFGRIVLPLAPLNTLTAKTVA